MGTRAWLAAPLAIPVAILAFIVNPQFGCGEDFEYGEQEMRALAEGTWDFSFPGEPAPRFTVQLSYAPVTSAVSPGSFVRAASACGDRRFVAGANACISSSSMALAARVVRSEPPFDPKVQSADLVVLGRTLGANSLSIRFASGSWVGLQPVSPAEGVAQQASLHTDRQPPAPLVAVRRR